jgi:hypothetical protein
MTPIFNDLMNGLDEVEAFLAGQTAGYNVSTQTHVPTVIAKKPGGSYEPIPTCDCKT